MGDGALYYAKGCDVWKRPVSTPRPGGGHTIALGFKVCIAAPDVGDEGAETIAAMLTMAERFETRSTDREPVGCPIPGACACPAETDAGQPSEASTAALPPDDPNNTADKGTP